MITRVLNFLVLTVLSLFLVTVSFMMFKSMMPAVWVKEVTVLTPVVSPGGVAVFRFHVIRKKQCPATIDRFLIRDDGHITLRETAPGGYGELGEYWPLVEVEVPRKAKPGTYKYRAFIQSTCGFYVQTAQTPDASFKVK